jgi:peptidyl-prolyl cis-trans isomerase C/peptidyl-prolyl cis-trans isomerase D
MSLKSGRSFLLTLIGCLSLFFAQMPLGHAEKVLAQVGKEKITLEEFEKKYQENLKFQNPYRVPTKKNVLDDMIKRLAGIQEAKRRGLHKKPNVIEQMETVLFHALVSEELTDDFNKITVSDSEVRNYYRKNPLIRTSDIVVKVAYNASEKEKKEALVRIRKIQKLVQRGEKSFAELANQYSDGEFQKSGGDLGFRTRNQLYPRYYAAALKLKKPGDVSGIVTAQDGFHLIKLTGKKSYSEIGESEKNLYKSIIFDEKRTRIFERFFAKVKSKTKIKVNPDLLN